MSLALDLKLNSTEKKEKKQKLLFGLSGFIKTPKTNEQILGLNQHLKKEIRFSKDDENIKYYKEYEYNKFQQKILDVTRDKNDKVKSFVEYKYDRFNRKTKCIFYNKNAKVNYYTTYEYDNNNNVIKETRYNGNDEMSYYIVYKYNKASELLSYTKFNSDGKKVIV